MPEPLSPLSTTANIRTMADDLAALARGEALPRETSPAPAGAPTAGTVGAAAPPRTGAPAVMPVGLPARPRGGRVDRRARLLLAGVLVLVLVGGGIWALRTVRPGRTGTIADALPVETLAFVSVQGPAGALPQDPSNRAFLDLARTRLASAVSGLSADRVAEATEVAYLLLPGPSPADPIPTLFVRGIEAVDLSQDQRLGVKTFRDGLLITNSTYAGRLEALRGAPWSSDAELRALLRGLPKDAPMVLGFRADALAATLAPLTPSLPAQTPVVLAVYPEGTGTEARVVGHTKTSWTGTTPPATPPALVERLPLSTVLALQREGTFLAQRFVGSSTSAGTTVLPGLEAMQRALGEQQPVVQGLRALLAGPGIVGVLPTAAPGIRDTVAVFPLHQGADPQPLLQQLEGAFREFGPALAGTPFPSATFAEGQYQGVTIRYVNFGSPARSFDYAVADGQLLVATSKASMFALLDTVRGTAESLAVSPTFAPLSRVAAEAAEWIFIQGDPALRAELPPAYAISSTLIQSLLVRPATDGKLEGRLLLQSEVPEAPLDEPLPAGVTEEAPGGDAAPSPGP